MTVALARLRVKDVRRLTSDVCLIAACPNFGQAPLPASRGSCEKRNANWGTKAGDERARPRRLECRGARRRLPERRLHAARRARGCSRAPRRGQSGDQRGDRARSRGRPPRRRPFGAPLARGRPALRPRRRADHDQGQSPCRRHEGDVGQPPLCRLRAGNGRGAGRPAPRRRRRDLRQDQRPRIHASGLHHQPPLRHHPQPARA